MRIAPLNSNIEFDAHIFGKQAFILNKLLKHSYPVLDGIVLSSKIFKEFIILGEIKEQVFSLYKAGKFEELRQLITNHEFSEDLKEEILTHSKKLGDSYALTTSSIFPSDIGFFNIPKDQLIEWIKKCWASVFNEQNTLNRTNMFPAVIIQKHLDLEKSGSLYTINPAIRDKTKLVVEVTTPRKSFFLANKVNFKVMNEKEFRNLDSPLFIDEMDNLLKLGASIEKSFKKPQKITWVFNEKFYITGTRRIDEQDLAYFQELQKKNLLKFNLSAN